ncbi:MAG: 3'-5' exonuclease, partial [Chloroflexota bacterium]
NVPQRGIGQRSLSDLTQWAQSRGVPEYRALRMLAGKEEADAAGGLPPFSSRLVKALTGFMEMMEGLVARSRELDLVDLLDFVVDGSGYKDYILKLEDGEERWENVLELRTVAQEYRQLAPSEALTAFLEGVALVSDVDGLESGADAVTLITLHQAKGLEFPVVFIVGMEEGILPHFRSLDDAGQTEEERRLCYVGITRAEQRLYLVRAFRRSLMGSSTANRPSRFLKDIPPHLISSGSPVAVEESQVRPSVHSVDRTAAIPQPQPVVMEMKTGDHVRHAQFGEGIVVSSQPARGDVEVVVAFDGGGVKKLLLSFARLEKVD